MVQKLNFTKMSEESKNAPIEQLVVSEDNVINVVNRIVLKKKDIGNPDVVSNLRRLVRIAKNNPNSRMTALALFKARKEILEYANEVYFIAEQEKMVDETTLELEAIAEILEKYTTLKK